MKPKGKKSQVKGVKFNIQDSEEEESMSEVDSQQNDTAMAYLDLASASNMALKVFNETDSMFRLFTNNDQYAKKRETVQGILMILEKMKGEFFRISQLKF